MDFFVPADNLAYLLKYDSIQGRFKGKVDSKTSPDAEAKAKAAGKKAEEADPDILVVNGKEMKVVSAIRPISSAVEGEGDGEASFASRAKTPAFATPSRGACFVPVLGSSFDDNLIAMSGSRPTFRRK